MPGGAAALLPRLHGGALGSDEGPGLARDLSPLGTFLGGSGEGRWWVQKRSIGKRLGYREKRREKVESKQPYRKSF